MLEQVFPRFTDFLYWNDFDVRSDFVFRAEVEHFLGFRNATDG